MGELMVLGTNSPKACLISPTTDSGVNCENRVAVSTVYGESTTQWAFMSSVSTVYATVQNPDGLIHYLWTVMHPEFETGS